ncbi:lipid phosphate phosphatase 1 [Irpex rosettiformis]|uniref:Lipid phosphate phosphatase 1 n=1 Tax=Irpex rosettiformis TaxID=378272 RepID=A0ACB8UB61_9APHY|nr:lipid phosphate phosphatase 1 [Irpex rosettiformis]
MSSLVQSAGRQLRNTFGDDALSWFDRSYASDWVVATVAWGISLWIKLLPPFERDFNADDPLINHKHRPNQISGNTNMIVAMGVPFVVVIVLGTLTASAMHIHHGLLSLYSGSGFTALITEALKNRVGQPDFLHRCKWIESISACSGNLDKVQDGRRSFPSGHSSEVFAGMTFLSLFLASITGAWLFRHSSPGRAFTSSRLARLFVTLLPIAYAVWVAVSRVEDYRHHKEDVIVGSLLGALTAGTCYLIYWPNPFTVQDHSAVRHLSRPRHVYGELSGTRTVADDYGYELANVERAEATV